MVPEKTSSKRPGMAAGVAKGGRRKEGGRERNCNSHWEEERGKRKICKEREGRRKRDEGSGRREGERERGMKEVGGEREGRRKRDEGSWRREGGKKKEG